MVVVVFVVVAFVVVVFVVVFVVDVAPSFGRPIATVVAA